VKRLFSLFIIILPRSLILSNPNHVVYHLKLCDLFISLELRFGINKNPKQRSHHTQKGSSIKSLSFCPIRSSLSEQIQDVRL
jgi:hypothetical protein